MSDREHPWVDNLDELSRLLLGQISTPHGYERTDHRCRECFLANLLIARELYRDIGATDWLVRTERRIAELRNETKTTRSDS